MSNDHPQWNVRAISVPGPDTDLALHVTFGGTKFLFGAAEGTQRAFAQKRVGMKGVEGIFLSGGAKGRGGLPGVLMTMADMGVQNVTIGGGPDLTHYLATLRASLIRDLMSIEPKTYALDNPEPAQVLFESRRMTVYGVALGSVAPQPTNIAEPSRPSQLSAAELKEWTSAIVQDMFRAKQTRATRNAGKRWRGMVRPSYPDDRYPLPLAQGDVATDMVYICRTPDVRGKFDANRAKELKVPNGPIRGKLARGETVEFDDPDVPGAKLTVRPEDCLFGGGPGSILIVVNCRTDNMPQLLESTAFAPYQSDSGSPDFNVHCIVHRVSRNVWHNPTYQAWMKTFGPKTQHLYADDIGTGEIFFNSATWNALKLNMLNAEIFPVPAHAYPTYTPPELPSGSSLLVANSSISMYPPKAPEVLPRHEKDQQFPVEAETLEPARQRLRMASPEYSAAVDAARASVDEEASKRGNVEAVPGDDIVVTTLGTGSAIPSKYRNVSATHLDIPDVGGVLLDCGEGTLGQMRRRWGSELPKIYAQLRMIFVSHMHADHHLGLSAILHDRFNNSITTPLYLVAPHSIALQLQETAYWQANVPREALENVHFVNINRLKRGWRPRRQSEASPSPSNAMQVDAPNGTTAAAAPASPRRSASPGPPGSPGFSSSKEENVPRDSNLVEEAMIEDVQAGVRRWPFQNVFRFHPDCNARATDTIFSLLEDLGLYEIMAPQVAHRGAAWGLVLSHKSGWKIAYSGDTKPCDTFVEAAFSSTILIHEATLEDEKPEVAELKGHSTFGQAIAVGRAMGARYVILNHFSQRYPKIPKLPVDTEDGGPTVAISFDFMSLKAKDTWKISHYMKALEILYAEEEAEDKEDGEEKEGTEQTKGEGKGKGGKGKNKGTEGRGEKRASTASPEHRPQETKRAREA